MSLFCRLPRVNGRAGWLYLLALGITSLLLAVPSPAQAAAPDLVVLGANVDESSPEAGEAFGFVATVHNQGDAQSGVTRVRYLRSTNSTITTADALQGTEAVGPRDPNTNYSATIRLTAPAAVGTYYYGACVDGVPGESDRANNCSESVEVQVLAQGDGTGGDGPVRPTVTSVQVVSDPGADGRYLAEEAIEVEVRFSVGVQMDRFASLTLALDVGGAAVPGLGAYAIPANSPLGADWPI